MKLFDKKKFNLFTSKSKNKFYIFIILGLITFCGLVLRVYDLNHIPAGFFCDEASITYNAYSLLTTGGDEFRKPFPILFQSFGNYRPGTSIYFSLAFVAIFGINEFSSRLPSAIIGTFGILLIFFLAQLLFETPIINILSAFLLAISPWEIHFSRIGQENIYLPVFLSLSLVLFLFGIKKKNALSFIVSFIFFGVTLYTYVVAYFIVPLFILILILLYAKNLWKMKYCFSIGFVIFLFMITPLVAGIKSGETMARFNDASSINRQKTLKQFAEKAYATYIDHFSYNFLFHTGDIGYPTHFITRFSIRGFGELYLIQFPFLVLGIIGMFINKFFKKESLLLFAWIIFYPLGSSVVPFTDGGGPFATRSIIGVIPFQILTALGIFFFLSFFEKRVYKIIISIILTLTILFSFSFYLQEYFVKYPLYSSDFWGWQFGPRDVTSYFLKEKNNYNQLILMGNFNASYIFIKFYDPKNTCNDKCLIGDIALYNPSLKQLYAVGFDRLNELTNFNFVIKKTIYYPNKNPAFYIGELSRK